MNGGILYDQNELISHINENTIEDWKVISFSQFCKTMTRLDFPCLFGKKAYQLSQCQILFVPHPYHPIEKNDLILGFLQYTNFVKNTPMTSRLLFPMIVFLQYPNRKLSEQHQYAWQSLQYLHDHDPLGWPETMQSDPESHDWSFCFNGVQLFINISAPSHHLMRSRNLAQCVVLVVNPLENFEQVASIHDKSGRKIRQKIRDRVYQYNEGFMPKTLGFFGEAQNLEWKQYQLFEPSALELKKCPIHIRKNTKNNDD